jgi:hypothetical protein
MSTSGSLEITTQDAAIASVCERYWMENGDGGYDWTTTELAHECGLANSWDLLQLVLKNSRVWYLVGECRVCGADIRRYATSRSNAGYHAYEPLCDQHQAEQRSVEMVEERQRQAKRAEEHAQWEAQAAADEERRRMKWARQPKVELSFTREELDAAILQTINNGGGWRREDGGLLAHVEDVLLGELRDALLARREELCRNGTIRYCESGGEYGTEGWIRSPTPKLTIVRAAH